MSLTLSVITYRDAAPVQPLSRQFDRLGGAIGRAVGNELVLEDPGKYISRVHARIEFRDGAWHLVDVGSNPSLVNERPVGPGRQVALADGDRVTIGDYQLLASVAIAAVPTLPPSPLQDVTRAPAPAATLDANPDDSLAGAGILDVGGDPLNPSFDPLGLNLFGSAPTPAPVEPAWRGAESDHVSPELAPFPATAQPPAPAMPQAAVPAAGGQIPDDYDPLADFLPPRVQAAPAPTPAPVLAPQPQAQEATAIAQPAPAPTPVPTLAPTMPPAAAARRAAATPPTTPSSAPCCAAWAWKN
jgi:type VI secretion system FHA domain protein